MNKTGKVVIVLMLVSALAGAFIGARITISQWNRTDPTLVTTINDIVPSVRPNQIIFSSSEINTIITDLVSAMKPADVTVIGEMAAQRTFLGYKKISRSADADLSSMRSLHSSSEPWWTSRFWTMENGLWCRHNITNLTNPAE